LASKIEGLQQNHNIFTCLQHRRVMYDSRTDRVTNGNTAQRE